MRDVASREALFSPAVALDGFSIDEPSSWTDNNVMMVYLYVNHERIVTLYHRWCEKALIGIQRRITGHFGLNGDIPSSSITVSVEGPPTESNTNLANIREAIYSSAARVTQLLDILLSQNRLRYAPSFV